MVTENKNDLRSAYIEAMGRMQPSLKEVFDTGRMFLFEDERGTGELPSLGDVMPWLLESVSRTKNPITMAYLPVGVEGYGYIGFLERLVVPEVK